MQELDWKQIVVGVIVLAYALIVQGVINQDPEAAMAIVAAWFVRSPMGRKAPAEK